VDGGNALVNKKVRRRRCAHADLGAAQRGQTGLHRFKCGAPTQAHRPALLTLGVGRAGG